MKGGGGGGGWGRGSAVGSEVNDIRYQTSKGTSAVLEAAIIIQDLHRQVKICVNNLNLHKSPFCGQQYAT